MGTKAAPVLVKLIMGFFEFTIYKVSMQKFGYSFRHYIRETGKTSMGGCFSISKDTIDKLIEVNTKLYNP